MAYTMQITDGWDSDEVLAERRCRTLERAQWWIRKLAPLYARNVNRVWVFNDIGGRTVVDF